MRTIAVLPMKSFGAAKQRLSAKLGGGSRQLLAQAMLCDVLAALRRVRRVDVVAVVTDDHEVEAMLRTDPVTVLTDSRRDGQSAAAMIGIEHAVAEGFRRVLLVPGDTPLLDPGQVDALLDAGQADQVAVTIVPDRHRTGTNALVISPPDALQPSFGSGSLERHQKNAREAGVSHRVLDVTSLMHDVDTAEDLEALGEELERRRGVAPRTRGALRQFDRLHVPPVGPRPQAPGGDGQAVAPPPAPARGAPWRPTRERASADGHPAWA